MFFKIKNISARLRHTHPHQQPPLQMRLQPKTKALPRLSLADANTVPIDTLADFYTHCADAYFNTDTPVVSDDTFDALEAILRKRSPHHSVLRTTGAVTSGEDKIRLPFWMGSQDKIYPENTKAFRRWKSHVGKTDVVASSKLDGLSSILVVTDKRAQLFSRGDGQFATDWTHHLRHLATLHKPIQTLQKWIHEHDTIHSVTLRGEAIMSTHHFEVLKPTQHWTSSARNIVSGLMNAKTSNAQLLRYVDIVFYEVVEPVMEDSFMRQLDFLHTFHFANVKESLGTECNARVLSDEVSLKDLEPLFWTYREKCPYKTDGVVVQSNTFHIRNTASNPKYAFAFKIRVNDASQTAQTVVTDVVWNVSRHGYLKPTIILEPVTISDVTIRKTTGFNYKFIKDNCIGKGTVVTLRRCGDVIPNVVGVVSSTTALLPSHKHTLTQTGVDAVLLDASQDESFVVEQLTHFFKVMEVPHVSEKTVRRFVEHGYSNVFQILNVHSNTLLDWDGFSHKSSQQLVHHMRESTRNADTLQWIHAGAVFGRGVGKKHIQHLLTHAPSLFVLRVLSAPKQEELRQHLLSLPGYQSKTVNGLLAHRPDFVTYWKRVGQHMGKRTPELPTGDHQPSSALHGSLSGSTFCFSGVRDKAFQKQLEVRGASFVTSVSKNVNVLICKSLDVASEKMTKATRLVESGHSIKILTLEECKRVYRV